MLETSSISMATDIILTSSPDGPVIAQDHLTGAVLAQFSITRSPRKGLAFTSGGLIAVSHITLSASGFIHFFNWWSCSILQSVPMPEPVAPLVATPNGSFLFAGGLSGRIYILSLPSCDLFRSFQAHQPTVSCLAVNSDGSLIISGGDDGFIAVFPIISLLDISSTESSEDDSVQTLYKFSAHSMSITSIASGTGGCNSIFISCSLDCMVKFWSLANGVCLRTVHLQCALWSVVLDSTDAEAYAGGSDGRIYTVAVKKRRRRRMSGEEDGVVAWSAEESSGAVIALAILNGDRNLVSAAEDGTIKIWEAGQVVRVLRHGRNGVSDLLVARGSVSRAVGGVRRDEGDRSFNGLSSMSCVEGMFRDVKEVEEMEEWLGVVVKDRRRAIDALESAINTYQRLLGLLLKEANGGE